MNPNDFRLFRNVALNNSATDDATSTVGEPATLNNGKNLFYTTAVPLTFTATKID